MMELFAAPPLAGCAALCLLCHRVIARRGACGPLRADVEVVALWPESGSITAVA